MWSILSTDPLLIELCPKVLVENSPNAVNLTSDFSAKISTAMSVCGRLSKLSSAAFGVVLSVK